MSSNSVTIGLVGTAGTTTDGCTGTGVGITEDDESFPLKSNSIVTIIQNTAACVKIPTSVGIPAEDIIGRPSGDVYLCDNSIVAGAASIINNKVRIVARMSVYEIFRKYDNIGYMNSWYGIQNVLDCLF